MDGVHVSRTRTVCALIRAVACARVSADARSCACLCVCARAWVCACVSVCARAQACVCVCVCVRARLLIWLCACACTACVHERCVRAPRRCARPPIARRWIAVFMPGRRRRAAARVAVAVRRDRCEVSRTFGRRCHLDVPHRQRGMGRAIWAHVGGRRRRRHLRHRRHRTLPIRRRVGQHRRRRAGRTRSRGVGRRVLRVGTTGGTRGYYKCTRRVLGGYSAGTRGY